MTTGIPEAESTTAPRDLGAHPAGARGGGPQPDGVADRLVVGVFHEGDAARIGETGAGLREETRRCRW